MTSLHTAIIAWAKRIQDQNLPWTTGIYPAEMATFLGLCELQGVRGIIESGRGPDAYSTHILGMYGDHMNVPVISIDFSPIEDHHFAQSLSKYKSLKCLNGDSFVLMPSSMATLPGPIGMLIDGPKKYVANRLSFALSTRFPVRVVAHHNIESASLWWKEFATVYQGAQHFEDLGLQGDPAWEAFRVWEHKATGGYTVEDTAHNLPGRTLDESSLGFAVIPEADRASLLTRIPSFTHKLQAKMSAFSFRKYISKQ